MFFRNHYRCARCGYEWSFVWTDQRNDECPNCGGKAMAPRKSEIATLSHAREDRDSQRRVPENILRRQGHDDRRRQRVA